MEKNKKLDSNLIYYVLWPIYVAILILFGEYIVIRPTNMWVQIFCSLSVIALSFYLIKETISSLKNR